jgi:hypothetical protein
MRIALSEKAERLLSGALYGVLFPLHITIVMLVLPSFLNDVDYPISPILSAILSFDILMVVAPVLIVSSATESVDRYFPTFSFLLVILFLILFWSMIGVLFTKLVYRQTFFWRVVACLGAFGAYTVLVWFFQNEISARLPW